MSETKVLPSEALFGFMGWLTSRGAVSGPFSASHDASSAAELVAEFVKSQGWEMPRDEFPKMLAEYPASPEPLTTDAPTPRETGAEVVTSHILTGRVGRDECVDIAMDYINNNIVHEEECESYARDDNGDRRDCNCGVGAGLKELERIARLATPRPDAASASVTYVPQRLSRDCGIAALAMASGLSYDEVAQRLPASAVRECAEGDGLFSAQMPQLLGLLGCAVRSVFSESWKSDGLRGIRIYVSRSHYIVMRPDGKVNDPARGEGLDASAYDEPFDGWEVHRLSVAARDAASASVVDIAPSADLPKLIQPAEYPGWRGDATVSAFRARLEVRIRETVDQVARVAGHAPGAKVNLKGFDSFLDCLCDAAAGAALAAAPRDAGREEAERDRIDAERWRAIRSHLRIMGGESHPFVEFLEPNGFIDEEDFVDDNGVAITPEPTFEQLLDRYRAARRGGAA